MLKVDYKLETKVIMKVKLNNDDLFNLLTYLTNKKGFHYVDNFSYSSNTITIKGYIDIEKVIKNLSLVLSHSGRNESSYLNDIRGMLIDINNEKPDITEVSK